LASSLNPTIPPFSNGVLELLSVKNNHAGGFSQWFLTSIQQAIACERPANKNTPGQVL